MSYPFAAIVGQEDLKLCLILCAIDPSIGGVLIRGDKGTAKSTASRGLAKLLPSIRVAYNEETGALDPYNNYSDAIMTTRSISTPFVELPIGATEDRVLGSLDFSRTLLEKNRVFAPGLLAAANRGILYIDEVNLLPAHLVDVLLDAAAMGVNTVQREGICHSHDAKFMLIGTMNPEEGNLRPQLLDRFGLMVDVVAPKDANERAEVVRQRIAFEREPDKFQLKWQKAQTQLTQQIQAAKDLLTHTNLTDDLLLLISRICTELQVASLRADITLYKTATALAAWNERTEVQAQDIQQAAHWVLSHRRRRQPFDSQPQQNDTNQLLDDLVSNHCPPDEEDGNDISKEQPQEPKIQQGQDSSNTPDNEQQRQQQSPTKEHNPDNNKQIDNDSMETFTASKPNQIKRLKLQGKQQGQAGTGRRNHLNDTPQRGYYVRSAQTDKPVDIALDATLRAAAASGLNADGSVNIQPENWRRKVRNSNTDTVILFVVDASGSMSARQRMEAVKGAVLALLMDAYQQRDQVGVIAFRGTKAEVILQPTQSVELAEKQLRRLPTGGRTPLAHALSLAYETIHRLGRHHQADTVQPILLIVLSDGKANVPLPDCRGDAWTQTEQGAAQLATLGVPTLMLDTEQAGVVRIGRAKELSELLKADYLRLDELSADGLVHTIRQAAG